MTRILALLLTCLIVGSFASWATYAQAAPPPPAAPGKIESGRDAERSLNLPPAHDPGTLCYTPNGWCQAAQRGITGTPGIRRRDPTLGPVALAESARR